MASDARRRAEEALAFMDAALLDEMPPLPTQVKALADAVRSLLAEQEAPATVECLCRCPETPGTHTATRCTDPALAAPDELREALARFGAALLPKWWDDGNPGDIDGADAQDAAEACGLWHRVERHADGVECEWCNNEEPCGELTEAGLSALAARGGE